MYKGALYRKMMQNGIKLSTQRPSESKYNFENSYFKINHFLGKNITLIQYFN